MTCVHPYARRALLLVQLALLCLGGCTNRKAGDVFEGPARKQPSAKVEVAEAIQLFDRTDSSSIDFTHTDGSTGKFLLPETMSGGLALFDYDRDGWIDIYFCNGAPLAAASSVVTGGHALYKNLGGLRFRNVTREAGLENHRFGLGVTVGDYDSDGFADIYLSNFGGNGLFHNDGQGSFVEDSQQVAELAKDRFTAGASFLDVNADGHLDLFAANYVRYSVADLVPQSKLARSMYPGPQDFPTDSSGLIINLGEGHWRDVSSTSGIGSVSSSGMGCVTGDFDSDGDLDIYVANDEMPNSFFRNDGSGNFQEVAVSLGVALDGRGEATGSMGVDAGDLDNDGRMDLFVTTFENELVNLYRLTEHQIYQDVTIQTQAGEGTLPHVTWGVCIADFENDGDRDIYIASGHLDDRNKNGYYHAPDLLLKNQLRESGQFRFTNIAARSGDIGNVRRCGRGSAVADLDNDGDMDVAVLNLRDQPTLMENRSVQAGHHWLQLELIGTATNRDAVGTKVRIVAGELDLVDEVRNGRGYQSYWGSRLHFGLGRALRCDRIEIDWLGGQHQVIESAELDRVLTIVQPR